MPSPQPSAPAEEPLDADFRIFRFPDLAESVLVEKHGNIQRIATRERRKSAEYRNFRGKGHRVVIGLNRVDRACLHCAEGFARRYELVGKIECDDALNFVDSGINAHGQVRGNQN